MDRSGLQRVIPVILVLIIVIVAIAALVSLGRTLFSGGNSQPTAPPVNVGKQGLTKTLADRSVRMTVRGPIVANEKFHSYTITASSNQRNMTTYVGYLGQQIDNEKLENNIQAYTQLVYALDRANLMEGKPLDDGANDTRGICATGTLYEFEVIQGTKSIQKLWTTTCKGAKGSLKANQSQVSKLFQQQIPDFSKLVSKMNTTS
jgi:hypothetical protein